MRETNIQSDREAHRVACAGGCGGSRICPGQAVLLALIAGYGLSALTGWQWMQPVVLVTGTAVLVTGWYRYLNPFRYLKFSHSK